nr:hypothetical protein [Streptomyces sp. CB01201]
MPSGSGTTLPLAVLALAVGALITGLLAKRSQRRPHERQRRHSTAVVVSAVSAVVCTICSADTSWRFAADYLAMRNTTERTVMFAAAELTLFAMALMARQNLHGPRRAAGLPGTMVWVITAMQAIPAYAEFGPVGGTMRAFTGPLMAAVLWHLAMGIELRQRTPEAASRGLAAVVARQARERLLASLGIVEQDQGAAQIIRERAMQQAVALAARLADMTPAQRTERAGRHTVRRLSKALARSGIDSDRHLDQLLLRRLATRRQAAALATIDLAPRWTTPAPQLASPPASQHTRPRADPAERPGIAGRADDRPCPHPADPGDEQPERAARPHPEPGPNPAVRPQHEKPTPAGSGPNPGDGSGNEPGEKTPLEPKQTGRKPRATDEILRAHAHRLLNESGRLTRDLLEETVRGEGYTVASDDAGAIVRAIKTELKAAATN